MSASVLTSNIEPAIAAGDFTAYPYPAVIYENIAEVKPLDVFFFHDKTLLLGVAVIVPDQDEQANILVKTYRTQESGVALKHKRTLESYITN